MSTLAVLDVETSLMEHGEAPRTKLWGIAVQGEDYRDFKSSREMWRYLRQRSDPLLLYHHHDYDPIQALIDGLPLTVTDVVHGRVLRSKGPGAHEWRNSYKLFNSPLKEILEACGFKKPGLKDLRERNRADTVDALAAFLMIAEGFEQAFGIYPLGSKYLTSASVAFAAAVKAAGKLPVELGHHSAYRGGRVEAFKISPEKGNGLVGYHADQWDIASSYPFAFCDLPARDRLFYLDVEVNPKWRGPCPFASQLRTDKLMFPNGRFRTAVWQSSFDRYIAPHGQVTRANVLSSVSVDLTWLKKCEDLIRGAFALRARVKKANPALAYACKIGLNSIYGRLGMGSEREVAFMGDRVASGPDVTFFPLQDGRILSFTDVKTKPTANYLFASAITCNARARLYDALRQHEGALYCDTDSLFLPKGTEFQGEQGDAIGQWKFEGAGVLAIRGLKDYVWNGKVKRKGGSAHFEWTVKKALNARVGVVRRIQKRRVSVYDKREILPSGNTIPVTFYEW